MKGETFNKKKLLIIILAVLILSVGGYCGTWYYYYNQVAMAHFPDASYGFEVVDLSGMPASSKILYSMTDENSDCFRYDVPKFGCFSASFGASNTVYRDSDHVVTNSDGVVELVPYTANGSKFSISGSGRFLLNGKLNGCGFNVERLTTGMGFPRTVYLKYSADGLLINRDDLSADDYEIYESVNPEIQYYIELMKAMFNF